MNKSQRDEEPQDGDYRAADGLIYCGKCRTKKQADITIPADRRFPAVTVRVPVLCRCEMEKRNVKPTKRVDLEPLRKAGLPKEYRGWNFATDDHRDTKTSDVCRKYAEYWTDMRKNKYGAMFLGGVGTGKTFMACCIANALIDKGVPVKMVATGEVASMGFNERRRFMDEVGDYALYILDDLGAERSTSYGQEQLKIVVDTLERHRKIVIVTTNLTLAEIEREAAGGNRIYDRLNAMCALKLAVTGKSRRAEMARENAEKVRGLLA